MQDAEREECGHDERAIGRAVEVTHSDRHLSILVEVAEVQNRIWDEATLDKTQQRARSVEALLASNERLADTNDTPCHHLDGNPDIRAELLRNHLRWDLGGQKA